MKETLHRQSRYVAKAFMPAKVLQSRLHAKVYKQFADRLGLVYFGYVDQRSDEHRLVRGLTVSAKHRDNHYCIGHYEGYDVMLVERSDTIHFPGKPKRGHEWIIMTFDLHTTTDLPHIFLGLHTHSDTFYAHLFTKFSSLTKVPLGTFGVYDPVFINKYSIYTDPSQTIQAEKLIDPQTAATIGAHFGTFTVEIADGCVYMYAENHRPTQALLEKMLKYGAWLAAVVDTNAAKLHTDTHEVMHQNAR
jgi:hypothetical protein